MVMNPLLLQQLLQRMTPNDGGNPRRRPLVPSIVPGLDNWARSYAEDMAPGIRNLLSGQWFSKIPGVQNTAARMGGVPAQFRPDFFPGGQAGAPDEMAALEAAAGLNMGNAQQGPQMQGPSSGLSMDPRMEALLNQQGGGGGGGAAFKPMEFDVEKYKQALTVPQSPEQLALRQRIMDMLSQPQPEMPNVQLPEPERERGWSDMSGGQKFASVLSGLAQMAGTGLTAYADPEIAARQTAQRREMEARRKERAEALLYQRAQADRDYGMQRWQAANQMQGNQINRMGTLYDMFSGDQRDTREMNRDIINRGMDVDMYNAQGQNRATERAEGRSYDAARDARNRAFDLLEGRQRGDIDMQNAVKGSLGASAMSAWGQYRKAVVAARDAKGTPQYESLLKQAALLKQEWDEQAAMAERAGIRLGF